MITRSFDDFGAVFPAVCRHLSTGEKMSSYSSRSRILNDLSSTAKNEKDNMMEEKAKGQMGSKGGNKDEVLGKVSSSVARQQKEGNFL